MSDEEWNFKTKNDWIYIENISKTKVLETSNYDEVTLKDFKEDKKMQLWKRGEPNTEGYFTLENSEIPKLLTAISSTIIKIKRK